MIYEFFRHLGMLSGYLFQLLFFKRKTYYENGVRKKAFKGSKLIISNHFNMVDYVVEAFLVYPRKLNVVASEHGFRNKFFAFGIKFFGGIQANRQTKSMRFMGECVKVLNKGQLVLIFPEGRNTPDGEIHEFKHSYLVIAHQANVPIVPVITDGNYSLFKRTRVMVGEEIDVKSLISSERAIPSRSELERANEVVYSKMLELKEELKRRAELEKMSKKRGNKV